VPLWSALQVLQRVREPFSEKPVSASFVAQLGLPRVCSALADVEISWDGSGLSGTLRAATPPGVDNHASGPARAAAAADRESRDR
jgi:hypothetical protein